MAARMERHKTMFVKCGFSCLNADNIWLWGVGSLWTSMRLPWNCNLILNIFSAYNVLAVDTILVFLWEYTVHYLHLASVHLSFSAQQIYSRSKELLI